MVIARLNHTKFVAVTSTCSHQQLQQITFQHGEFYCTAHGVRFDVTGKGLNEAGKPGLTTYRIEQTGTTLRVFS
ncbi:MAG: Rieske 2Fe-2S domain-containing protein [Rudanella sp.]|nr:Rieske 2Fe-2S domain-containing protein [Rudanella sp.]